jgi:hypothetical protein
MRLVVLTAVYEDSHLLECDAIWYIFTDFSGECAVFVVWLEDCTQQLEAEYSSETLGTIYQITWRIISEDKNLHLPT